MEKKIDLVILDESFKRVAVVDFYTSLNWKRNQLGDGTCEFDVPITPNRDLSFIKRNHYILRNDDEMVVQILYTEIRESNNGPDIMHVQASDITMLFLNKRIVFSAFVHTGTVTSLVTKLLNENFSATDANKIAARRIYASDNKTSLIQLEFVGSIGEEGLQYQAKNDAIGDIIHSVLETYRYAMQMVYREGTNGVVHFVLRIFRPSNRAGYVIFDEKMDNIVNTNFSSEFVRGSNLILVGGAKQGTARYYQSVGSNASGLDRNEEFLDEENLSRTINWTELLLDYPPKKKVYDFPTDPVNGGTTVYTQIVEDGQKKDRWLYRMGIFKIPIQDQEQFTNLRNAFKSYEWGPDTDPNTGITYFCIKNCDIALLTQDVINNPPKRNDDGTYESNPSAETLSVLYLATLIQKGWEKYQEGTIDCSFSAEIDPNATYQYKRDYIIGDYVGIYNKYGIKSAVQVTDVTETVDASGYHLDVSLSDAKSKQTEDVFIFCGTDAVDSVYLCTDNGDYILM